MRTILLTLILSTLVGCAGAGKKLGYETYEVEPEFTPLKRISERPDLVLSSTAITTVGETAYVVDLDEWLGKHRPGSATYVAKLAHEQVHSIRQNKKGTFLWVSKYLWDTKFMWEEEQQGWFVEITQLRKRGKFVKAEAVAALLAGYKNLRGKMVDYEEALKWVKDVLAGRWTP